MAGNARFLEFVLSLPLPAVVPEDECRRVLTLRADINIHNTVQIRKYIIQKVKMPTLIKLKLLHHLELLV